MKRFVRTRLLLAAVMACCGAAQAADLVFNQGDHVAFIGNALPDRMQHTGWLETYLQTANPGKNLVIRNLGFTGDQVDYRPRNKNFPDEHTYLTLCEADVIFAFFGYNEAFAQDPARFKETVEAFLDDAKERRYNGESAPRMVLISPIAHEDLENPHLPDGSDNNLWLSIYTATLSRIASEYDIPFVDLHSISEDLYDESAEALTINGVHLNNAGNKAIARAIVEALQGEVSDTNADMVNAAVLDKNWCWFNRYRATDGNDVWGSRASLKFVNDQTNAEVLQHELVMLDIKTANRDRTVWSAIQGEVVTPNDSNVPDPVLVETNYRPSEKNGALSYTSPEEGLESLKLAGGLEGNIFASEKMFPEFVNPVQLAVDTQGRLWAAVWETYPKWQPDREMLDKLVILPDNDRDGVADEMKTFAYVHNPTGFTFWNGGVVVASAPNIWFLKDTDGDDVADHKEILFSGIDSSDTHHSANGFDYGPDGYIYYQRGVFNVSNVETPWEAAQLSGTSAMYRFNPRTHRFSIHADNSPNPHGGDFDYWGYQYASDGTSGQTYQVRPEGNGSFKMHQLLEKTVRPVASSGILSSSHFPPESQGNYMILNCIGFLGIKQYTMENNDGEMWGTETEDLLVSSDGNFRPSDFAFGDDGALYVADWANALIGHMQHNIRDPSRDHDHGRIYRVTVAGRDLEESVKIDGQPITALLDVLKHPTNTVRLRARIELSERDEKQVLDAANAWANQFDAANPDHAHHLMEVLWLHQQFDVVNESLLNTMLSSPNADARRAAERVKYIWVIEGQVKGEQTAMQEMEDHSMHAAVERPSLEDDYLKQEPSPEPRMDGDTYEITIHTVKEEMRYDRTEFTVAAGMKVRLIFYNPDAMDHNLIMTEPGAAEEVAMQAMLLGANGVKREWRPDNDKILFASGLLSIGERETMEFNAPETPGRYDYVCTFPGHWQLMRGVMTVVDELDENTLTSNTGAQSAADDFFGSTASSTTAPPAPPAPVEVNEPQETRTAKHVSTPEGFVVDLLYEVPETLQGSWVAMTKIPGNRLVASDQNGKGLFLVSPPRLGSANTKTRVEKIDVPVTGAQGLCWANGALYANVSNGDQSGIWRIRDTDGDRDFDRAEHLLPLRGSGEHGPHGIVPAPDGRGLFFMAGNNTRTPDYGGSYVSGPWGDDRLPAQQWDDLGNPRGPIPNDSAPGGWVAWCEFDGTNVKLIANGFRNAYDIALNPEGEAFTFDSDTEWDLGLPWYRPAAVYHLVQGGEYGWRPGTAKWPSYFTDAVKPLEQIGPATARGVVFGTGAQFPARYQSALYALDWRYGAIYALHPTADGATFDVERELFLSANPLAVTDAVIGNDGNMYFIVGGRGIKSALYRVSYVGGESTIASTDVIPGRDARSLRNELERMQGNGGEEGLDKAWTQLHSADSALRYAARVAVEHHPVSAWRARALRETNTRAQLAALLALARQGEESDRDLILQAISEIDYDVDPSYGLEALRVCQVAFARMGAPDEEVRTAFADALLEYFPSGEAESDSTMAELLAYLGTPAVIERMVPLLDAKSTALPAWAETIKGEGSTALYGGTVARFLASPPPLQSLEYAFVLRELEEGWTPAQREQYFSFFADAAKRQGGPRYGEYLTLIRAQAAANCTASEREHVASLLETSLLPAEPSTVSPPKGPGKSWTAHGALNEIKDALADSDFDRGKSLFHAAACSLCHQFDGQGGVGGAIGPELSSVRNKYSIADLLEAMISPSENVPDQYGSVIATTKSGETFMGRPVEGLETVQVIAQDPEAPVKILKPEDLESIKYSPISQMPPALLNMLSQEELRDLVAYLLSSGDKDAPVYKQ